MPYRAQCGGSLATCPTWVLVHTGPANTLILGGFNTPTEVGGAESLSSDNYVQVPSKWNRLA